tara:strand:- start:316 stop:537 length:222 start_codon:yes stop_codon:yes gene_type:complete
MPMATQPYILSAMKVWDVRSCSAFRSFFPNLELKLSQKNVDTLAELITPQSLCCLNFDKLKKLTVRFDEKFYL